jgi:hypothetical protein
MPFFPEMHILSLLTTIFWLWMLIDCVLNKRLNIGSKVGWLLFIFFTQIVGAIVYFFAACARKNPFEALPYYISTISQAFQPKGNPPQRSPQPQQSSPKVYPDYQEGYQAQHLPVVPTIPAQEELPYHPHAEYEQPTATYPEMPTQQH